MLRLRSLLQQSIRPRITHRRFQSSFPQLLAKLQESTAEPSQSDFKAILTHSQISQNIDLIGKVFEIVESRGIDAEEKAELHNLVLKELLQYDSSLVTHLRSLNKMRAKIDIASLHEVIKVNKGRVDSSWEIFERWCSENKDVKREDLQDVLKTVLQKVVYGDPSDLEDGFTLSSDGILKATWIIGNLDFVEQELKSHVFLEAIKSNELALVGTLGVETLQQLADLSPVDEKLVAIWSMSDGQNLIDGAEDETLSLLERVLVLLAKKTTVSDEVWGDESLKKWAQLNSSMPSLSVPIFEKSVVHHAQLFEGLVSSLKPYTASSSSKYTQLRQSLLKCYGIHLNDFKEASKTYSEYIVDDKYNVDSYMATMTQVSCYLAAKEKSRIYLELAEAMIPPEHTPVKSLRAKILASAMFSTDESLDVYNEWISKLSKVNNDSGVSQAGLLTESLILAFLSRGEREFAYVIRDGAVDHGILVGETALDRVKTILKRYGEILGEMEESGMQNLLDEEVLLAIERL